MLPLSKLMPWIHGGKSPDVTDQWEARRAWRVRTRFVHLRDIIDENDNQNYTCANGAQEAIVHYRLKHEGDKKN